MNNFRFRTSKTSKPEILKKMTEQNTKLKSSVRIGNERPDLFVYDKKKREISRDSMPRLTTDCQSGENEK